LLKIQKAMPSPANTKNVGAMPTAATTGGKQNATPALVYADNQDADDESFAERGEAEIGFHRF
jgi:hypothetical protein